MDLHPPDIPLHCVLFPLLPRFFEHFHPIEIVLFLVVVPFRLLVIWNSTYCEVFIVEQKPTHLLSFPYHYGIFIMQKITELLLNLLYFFICLTGSAHGTKLPNWAGTDSALLDLPNEKITPFWAGTVQQRPIDMRSLVEQEKT